MDRRPAATWAVAGQFCAADSDSRTAGSDALSSEPGTGDQPHRQPDPEGVGRRQHQVGFGGYQHLGRFLAGRCWKRL